MVIYNTASFEAGGILACHKMAIMCPLMKRSWKLASISPFWGDKVPDLVPNISGCNLLSGHSSIMFQVVNDLGGPNCLPTSRAQQQNHVPVGSGFWYQEILLGHPFRWNLGQCFTMVLIPWRNQLSPIAFGLYGPFLSSPALYINGLP